MQFFPHYLTWTRSELHSILRETGAGNSIARCKEPLQPCISNMHHKIPLKKLQDVQENYPPFPTQTFRDIIHFGRVKLFTQDQQQAFSKWSSFCRYEFSEMHNTVVSLFHIKLCIHAQWYQSLDGRWDVAYTSRLDDVHTDTHPSKAILDYCFTGPVFNSLASYLLNFTVFLTIWVRVARLWSRKWL